MKRRLDHQVEENKSLQSEKQQLEYALFYSSVYQYLFSAIVVKRNRKPC